MDTSGRLVTDITELVDEFAAMQGAQGLVHLFALHATCGLGVMETGSGSEDDLVEALERLVPRDDIYRHRHGPVGHGGDHLAPLFISPSLTLPVHDNALVLGTWQRVVVVDPNSENNRRQIRVTFVNSDA